jgi:hypothetical protein
MSKKTTSVILNFRITVQEHATVNYELTVQKSEP